MKQRTRGPANRRAGADLRASHPAKAKAKTMPGTRTKTKTTSGSKSAAEAAVDGEDTWRLKLYVAGQSPKCVAAVRNLNRFCEQHLAGRYSVEVIDLLENPRLARDDQILAIPTLVRKVPQPLRKIVGDLSNRERMLVGFELRATSDMAGGEQR
jgi:circadian clock protein KaiB